MSGTQTLLDWCYCWNPFTSLSQARKLHEKNYEVERSQFLYSALLEKPCIRKHNKHCSYKSEKGIKR